MRSKLRASLVLLAAAGSPAVPPSPVGAPPLPLPPIPPLAAAEPGATASAREALHRAQEAEHQAVAAASDAAAAAAAAAAERAKLSQVRAAITERLRLVESAIEKIAVQLDQLARERNEAHSRLESRVAEFTPVLPILERLSMYPAASVLAAPVAPEDALRGVLVLQAMAQGFAREAEALRAAEARVDAISAKISAAKTKLTMAEDEQTAEAQALDQQIAATRTVEQTAIGQQAAAEAVAATAAKNAKSLKEVIAAIAEAARQAAAARKAEAARQALAAQAQEAAHAREELALARPATPVPIPPEAPPSVPAPTSPAPVLGHPAPPRAPGAPVVGTLVSRYGAPTPAGPAPGIRYQTAPGAHVLAPCAGNIEFAAPFRSYGRLVILDCGADYRFVLAGMKNLLVAAGNEVAAGQALGVMAYWNPGSPGPRPTLYLELHHGNETINPLPWLQGRG